MAKGQQRSNKEAKKPKATKNTAATSSTSPMSKGQSQPVNLPKKKA